MTKKKIAKQKISFNMGRLNYWLLVGITLISGGMLFILQPVRAADIEVYKSPTCGCCNDWVDHLQENGFSVEVHNLRNMNSIKIELGVSQNLQSCHTAKIGQYVIEGHVPASDVKRMLREKPDIAGLAVPGMPVGSPGMEGPRKDAYDVLTFRSGGKTSVYSSHNQ